MDNLTTILAALAAFFTLITGAFAVAVTLAIVYFRKLQHDREKEIQELLRLQGELQSKLAQVGRKSPSEAELEEIKKEFSVLRNSIIHSYAPYSSYSTSKEPSNEELRVMISDLLAQVASLQKQLGEGGQ